MDDEKIIERLLKLEALADTGATERKKMEEKLDEAVRLLQTVAVEMAVHKGRLGMLLWMATTMGAFIGFVASNIMKWAGKGG